jgi:hypothetical protein
MTVALVPDAEALVSQFLRSRDEITTLVAQRVFTAIPNDPTFPLLLVRRVAGAPVTSRPLHLDAPVIQLDAFGGSKKQAHDLLETARAVMAVGLEGKRAGGTVSGVRFGPMSWLPDADYTPARARYTADVEIFLHP